MLVEPVIERQRYRVDKQSQDRAKYEELYRCFVGVRVLFLDGSRAYVVMLMSSQPA